MSDDLPKISVLIASHNRPAALAQCLQTLQSQTIPPHEFEVIVIDDYSPEPIMLQQFPGGPVIKVYRTAEKSGPGPARNLGALAATGTLFVFTDDDCLADPGWLQALWDAHQHNPGAMLGGRLYNAVPHYLGAEASQVISDIVYAWYNATPHESRFFSTNNLAVPAADFRALGMFRSEFRGASEDRDLCDRWRASGRRMVYVPGALIGHAHKLTVRRFVRQHYGYGLGAAVFHRERQRRGGGSIVDEMPFHRALPRLAIQRLRREPAIAWPGLLTMLGLWQLANAAGYAMGRLRLAGK